MVVESSKDIHFSGELKYFRQKIHELKEGTGSILCVSGESGFGKSHLLDLFERAADSMNSGISYTLVKTQPPIGRFMVGNIQPLMPFTKSLENLLSRGGTAAKTKFALKAGLTVLTGIPIAGDLFYMAKELGRDWRDYKKDKSSSSINKISTGAADYYDTFCSLADKSPLVLLLDDMQWSDAQSVELLNIFAGKIQSLPVFIVISYNNSDIQRKGAPLVNFVNNHIDKTRRVDLIELQQFNKKQLSELCKFSLQKYKPNKKFEDWLFDHSYGVPGVIIEYLNYFQQKSPFLPDGTLDKDFSSGDFLPATVQTAFAPKLENISEEDRNILAVCSSEGRRFTANVISELLNTDILTTIKKLRSIINKTGIIKSIGAQSRYGIKTTVYEFTQAFYHQFFENSLEYEEHIALHGQIAALLKKKYDDSSSESVKQEIAPFIAAHSAEAGDEETTKSMLLEAAKAAREYGSAEIVQNAYNSFIGIEDGSYYRKNGDDQDKEESPEKVVFENLIMDSAGTAEEILPENGSEHNNEEGNGSIPADINGHFPEFSAIRRAVVNAYHQGKFSFAAGTASDYLKNHEDMLKVSEKSILISLIIKSYLDSGDIISAEKYADIAKGLLNTENDPVSECFISNACAVLYYESGRKNEALDMLTKAAQKALKLPPEMRLMTLSNIVKVTKNDDPQKAHQYISAIKQLSSRLQFDDLSHDLDSGLFG